MIYAQAAFYYALKTAAVAGIFCFILPTTGGVAKELFHIILTGTIACLVLPILLKYILTAAVIVMAWRILKDMRRKAAKAKESTNEIIWNNSYVMQLQAGRHMKKLQKMRQRRRQQQLKKEIRAIQRQNP